MSEESPPVALSGVDEERFGIRTAKTSLLTSEDLPGVMGFCEQNQVRFLIARCPAQNLRVAQDMEKLGFSLMDTLVYYSFDLKKPLMEEKASDFVIRHVMPGEEHAVRAMAEESFRNYPGHYHQDRKLEKRISDEIYPDWAFKSCLSREVADAVLVAECQGKLAAFATMCARSGGEGEGLLFGVTPPFQGRGVYRLLMAGGMRWCIESGLSSMVVSTQVTNTAVQKVWVRLGFEPCRSYYTFHKWFDPPEGGGTVVP